MDDYITDLDCGCSEFNFYCLRTYTLHAEKTKRKLTYRKIPIKKRHKSIIIRTTRLKLVKSIRAPVFPCHSHFPQNYAEVSKTVDREHMKNEKFFYNLKKGKLTIFPHPTIYIYLHFFGKKCLHSVCDMYFL